MHAIQRPHPLAYGDIGGCKLEFFGLSRQATQAACGSCQHKLPADAKFCPRCGAATPTAGKDDPLIGQIAGERYLILDLIGHGGSGTIYRGEHVTLRRKVAVKVLHHELSQDDLALERFRREATTVGEIDNDHIVDIHDFGRMADGRLYLAMELCEGETLAERCAREDKLDIAVAIDILTQLGEALMEAHAMGYVHRDLRPRNVFLAHRRGRDGYVKLLDFGLAKLVSKGGAASTSLGMTFGDPRYMSPEQARGDPVDQRADIYSLGCIAYEMICGAPPFAGGKVFDILTRQVESVPEAPAHRREGVPPWLGAAVMRMLAKDPEERFATVYRMIGAIEEGQKTGSVMPDEVARTREAEPPPSVSRAMAKLGARAAAEAKLESEEDAARGAVPEEGVREVPDNDKDKGTDKDKGLSGAWYADGDALDGDPAESGAATRARMARDSHAPSSTSQLYFDPGSGRRKMIAVAAVAVVVVVILAAVLWPASDKAVAGTEPAIDAHSAAAVAADAAPPVVLADAAPVPVDAAAPKPHHIKKVTHHKKPHHTEVTHHSTDPDPDPDPGPGAADRAQSQKLAQEGLAALRAGDILSAAGKLNRAIELYPKNAAAIAGLGEIALTQGAAQDAVHHLRRAANLRPTARTLTLLGEAYLALGDHEHAKAAFKKALQRDPDNVRARNGYNEAAGVTP